MKKLLFLSLLLAVPALQAADESAGSGIPNTNSTTNTNPVKNGNWASQIVDRMLSPVPQSLHFPLRVGIGLGAGYGIYEAVSYFAPDKIDSIIDSILSAVPGEDLQTIIKENKAHFCALGVAAYIWGMTLPQLGNVISAAGITSLVNVTRNRMRGHRGYRASNNEYGRILYELLVVAGPQFIKYAPQLIAFFK